MAGFLPSNVSARPPPVTQNQEAVSACVGLALVSLRLMTRLALQHKAQELLQRERGRIARDIHDDIGAGLTQLVLMGEVAQSELPPGSETRLKMQRLCKKARDILAAMDEIVWAINSRRDTLRDFVGHVCNFAQAFLRDSPLRCRLDVEPDIPTLPFPLPIRRNLFLAVQEALNNAAKHSGATELFLRIRRSKGDLLVSVEDNGSGFDPACPTTDRNGLSNMAQRTEEMGGRWSIDTRPGQGCRIEFRIPIGLSKSRPFRLWLFSPPNHPPLPRPLPELCSTHPQHPTRVPDDAKPAP